MNLSHPLIKKQVGKRQKTLTWYLLSSVEGEPKYLSEKAEAEGEREIKEVTWRQQQPENFT